MKKFVLTAFMPFLLLAFADAQLTTLKEYKETQKDHLHEFVKPGPGLYGVLDYASPHGAFSYERSTLEPKYTIYDAKLNIKSSVVVEGLKKKECLGFVEGAGNLHVFMQRKKEVLYASLDLNTGQLKNTPLLIYKTTQKTIWFYKGYSVDSNYSYAVSSFSVREGDAQVFEGVIMDKNMNVIKNISVKLEDMRDTFHSIEIFQNSDGTLLITSCVRVKKSRKKYFPYAWLITEIDKKGQSTTTFMDELPEGRIENMMWKITKEGINFTCFRSRNEKERNTSIISGDYNIWRKKIVNIKETEISNAPFWSTVTDKTVLEYKRNGLPFAKIIKFHLAQDGTKYLIMQWYATISRASSRGYMIYDSYAQSIYAMSIAHDNTLNWFREIPVYHSEPIYQTYTGSVATYIENKGFFIFYNDGERDTNIQPQDKIERINLSNNWNKKENTFVVNVTLEGNVNKTVAGNYMDQNHHFAIGQQYRFYHNELFFTSYRKRGIGRSTYKPALFIIN